ncbi:TolC family protein [bacterium]|nr:TolC family protein [bacterium]
MNRLLIGVIVLCLNGPLSWGSQPLSLSNFISDTLQNHPFLKQETLGVIASRFTRNSTQGSKDITLSATASNGTEEPLSTSPFNPTTRQTTAYSASASRSFWSTGGTISVTAGSTRLDQNYPTTLPFEIGPNTYYENSLTMTYSQPLWQNLGGNQFSYSYDLGELTVQQTLLQSQKNVEGFVASLSHHYLDWAFLESQKEIADKRFDLAKKAEQQTRNQLKANLVDKVDLLRSQDAVRIAEQRVLLLRSQLIAKRTQLATQTNTKTVSNGYPSLDLYQRNTNLPHPNTITIKAVRSIQLMDKQKAMLIRQRTYVEDLDKPNVTLDISHKIADGDTAYSQSTDYSNTDQSLSLNVSKPFFASETKNKRQSLNTQIRQLEYQTQSEILRVQSMAKNLYIQITELERIMDLNQTQITFAKEKTKEELRFYNQGRSQLAFVIQSQDNEQNAQLTYATNALNYHQMTLTYLNLIDRLPHVPRGPF